MPKLAELWAVLRGRFVPRNETERLFDADNINLLGSQLRAIRKAKKGARK